MRQKLCMWMESHCKNAMLRFSYMGNDDDQASDCLCGATHKLQL